MPINIHPRADPTAHHPAADITTLKEAAASVSAAYNTAIDILDVLLDVSIEMRNRPPLHNDRAQKMEQYIERMKSILESENLRFHYMTQSIRKNDPVEKLRAWRMMGEQDVELAVLREGDLGGLGARMANTERVTWVLNTYGLHYLWLQAEQRDAAEGILH